MVFLEFADDWLIASPPFLRRNLMNTVNKIDIKSLQKTAYEFGCDGLVGRVAYNLKTQAKFHANTSEKKDGPFFCKKCTEKIDHFAHKAPLSPAIGGRESELHKQSKNEICDRLKELFPNGKWETEKLRGLFMQARSVIPQSLFQMLVVKLMVKKLE